MKNKKLIISLLVLFAIGLTIYFIFYFTNNDTPKTANYSTNRTEANINNTNNENSSNIDNQNLDNANKKENNNNSDQNNSTSDSENNENNPPPQKAEPTPVPEATETEISSFTTKIYTKDANRQNNVRITCSSLNGTIVPNGSTFSFCNTVGQATTGKGYKKAEIFDAKGNKKLGLGGGNCQISSTLYNAVLKVDSLKVTERHAHSNKVPYVQTGKDAAVAYGSYDFKFVNNSGNSIKIKAEATADNVTISLLKIS